MKKGKYIKDFDSWNLRKKEIQNNKDIESLFKVGEVWWCSIGINVGDEQDGKHNNFERPVFIYKKFNKNLFIGIPLTSNDKPSIFIYNFSYNSVDNMHKKLGQAILSQVRPFSSKRLLRKIGKVEYEEFGLIRKSLRLVI